MLLPDVNVLVYAHRADARDHTRYREWLEGVGNGQESFALADLVLSGFLRVVTHPRVFAVPTPLDRALEFAETLRSLPNAVHVEPGDRHWDIFASLCRRAEARGDLVPDAWLAALAIESGSEWITTDRDYARFPGLRWRHPLAQRTGTSK
jgi:toxin-antitoxin system PIN domain toxin